MHKKNKSMKLTSLIPEDAKKLLKVEGIELIKQLGEEVIRGVVFDVLCGKNIRDSTEMLTRKRLATLNAAMLMMFIKGFVISDKFFEMFPKIAFNNLKKRQKKEDKMIFQWMIGLTNKAFQNILRDSPEALDEYNEKYVNICEEVIKNCKETYGNLGGYFEVNSKERAELDWKFLIYFMNTIGAQTLAIRGSDKSMYGKFFEKLILGSLLTILGFEYSKPEKAKKLKRIFWLSSRDEKRESDATLLFEAGKGVRFDIGFIGRGNPEITLDKVTRFERQIVLGHSKWYLATIIIVDRIGEKSSIVELAKRVGGTIIQMSMGYWPKKVAIELNRAINFQHELIKMPEENIKDYLHRKIMGIKLEKFLNIEN